MGAIICNQNKFQLLSGYQQQKTPASQNEKRGFDIHFIATSFWVGEWSI
jgi:hypothetical protein